MPEVSLSNVELAWLRELLQQATGIRLGDDKRYLYETRLHEECRRRRTPLPEFLQCLRQSDKAAVADFVTAMTTQETLFYRDLGAFDLLRDEILPDLLERNRSHRRLRIWSAACATGQEIYSVAMVLRSHYPQLADWQVELWGTDISERSLVKARSGRYTQGEVNRGLPITKLLRYFQQDGEEWVLLPEMRALVRFVPHNLLEPPPGGTFDLILCRNVLIYFDVPAKQRILDNLRQRLPGHGVLMLGGSERLFAVTEDFEPTQRGGFVYYRPKRG